ILVGSQIFNGHTCLTCVRFLQHFFLGFLSSCLLFCLNVFLHRLVYVLGGKRFIRILFVIFCVFVLELILRILALAFLAFFRLLACPVGSLLFFGVFSAFRIVLASPLSLTLIALLLLVFFLLLDILVKKTLRHRIEVFILQSDTDRRRNIRTARILQHRKSPLAFDGS